MKPVFQPFNNRNEGLNIGCVARPHLAAHRVPLVVKDYTHNHLPEIRPVILGVAVISDGFAAFTLEVDGSGIKENTVQAREQIPSGGKQFFFDDIFRASWGKGRAVALIRDLFSKKAHGPVQMMQLEILAAAHNQIPLPLITATVRARDKEPVQNRQKDGPFDIELELATLQKASNSPSDLQIPPQALEDQGRANRVCLRLNKAFTGEDHQGGLGEPGYGTNQTFDVTLLLELFKPTQSCNNPLNRLFTFPAVLDDLQVLILACFFNSGEHGESPLFDTPLLNY
jgi:hypothetical protein